MRPQSITVLCILLFLVGSSMAIRSIAQLFLAPGFLSFFMLIISVIGLYCYYGLWNMKRWCIPLFYSVWGAIALPMLIEIGSLSMIMLLRTSYLVAVMVIFTLVVFPHKDKLSSGLVWPLN